MDFPPCFVFTSVYINYNAYCLKLVIVSQSVAVRNGRWSLLQISGCVPRKHLENYSRQINKLIIGGNSDHLHHIAFYDNRMKMKYLQSWKPTALGNCHFELIRKIHFSNILHWQEAVRPCFWIKPRAAEIGYWGAICTPIRKLLIRFFIWKA